MAPCEIHDHATAGGVCRSCLGEFCEECLVYSFGTAKTPHCMGCALAAAGARTASSTRPDSNSVTI